MSPVCGHIVTLTFGYSIKYCNFINLAPHNKGKSVNHKAASAYPSDPHILILIYCTNIRQIRSYNTFHQPAAR